MAGAPLQCEVVLQDVDHDSDDSAWEILHSATASEASTATFPLALPVHIEDQCSPSSGSWHRQVSPDACLSATPVIIKESSAQIAVPKDTEADNFLGAEDLPLSRVIAAKRSPVKKAESPNPAPYGGSEHMAGSMSDICGRAHAVSHSTGKAISGKQAEDEGGNLQAEKNLHAELERKVAELEQMIAARQIYTSAAMQSGSEGECSSIMSNLNSKLSAVICGIISKNEHTLDKHIFTRGGVEPITDVVACLQAMCSPMQM